MLSSLRQLLAPPAGMQADFLHPPGAAALTPANSLSWEVFANPVSLFIGGVAAVLLELAEPAVRSGVWDHSSFQRDPLRRLQRTGYAAMITVYAPRAQAEAMIARVVQMHERVSGLTPDGQPYRANDPQLLDWVQATASFGFSQAFHAYVRRLSPAEKSQVFAEGRLPASLYGATGAPGSWSDWERLLAATAPRLESSAILAEFLQIMETAPIFPPGLRWLQKLLVAAAVEITPAPVRCMAPLRGRGLAPGQRRLVQLLGAIAGWLPLPGQPATQARQRMAARH